MEGKGASDVFLEVLLLIFLLLRSFIVQTERLETTWKSSIEKTLRSIYDGGRISREEYMNTYS